MVARVNARSAAQGRRRLRLREARHRAGARFTEIESGSRNDRPELDKALTLARLTGATLVIAKLSTGCRVMPPFC